MFAGSEEGVADTRHTLADPPDEEKWRPESSGRLEFAPPQVAPLVRERGEGPAERSMGRELWKESVCIRMRRLASSARYCCLPLWLLSETRRLRDVLEAK